MALNREQIVHINLVNWFHETYPDLADDLHHFANERKCSVQQGVLLKRMGVKKGVSDFFLAYPNPLYHGLWLELKVGSNTLSESQMDFLNRKNDRGYLAVAAWEIEPAKAVFTGYIENTLSDSWKIKIN